MFRIGQKVRAKNGTDDKIYTVWEICGYPNEGWIMFEELPEKHWFGDFEAVDGLIPGDCDLW